MNPISCNQETGDTDVFCAQEPHKVLLRLSIISSDAPHILHVQLYPYSSAIKTFCRTRETNFFPPRQGSLSSAGGNAAPSGRGTFPVLRFPGSKGSGCPSSVLAAASQRGPPSGLPRRQGPVCGQASRSEAVAGGALGAGCGGPRAGQGGAGAECPLFRVPGHRLHWFQGAPPTSAGNPPETKAAEFCFPFLTRTFLWTETTPKSQ